MEDELDASNYRGNWTLLATYVFYLQQTEVHSLLQNIQAFVLSALEGDKVNNKEDMHHSIEYLLRSLLNAKFFTTGLFVVWKQAGRGWTACTETQFQF